MIVNICEVIFEKLQQEIVVPPSFPRCYFTDVHGLHLQVDDRQLTAGLRDWASEPTPLEGVSDEMAGFEHFAGAGRVSVPLPQDLPKCTKKRRIQKRNLTVECEIQQSKILLHLSPTTADFPNNWNNEKVINRESNIGFSSGGFSEQQPN